MSKEVMFYRSMIRYVLTLLFLLSGAVHTVHSAEFEKDALYNDVLMAEEAFDVRIDKQSSLHDNAVFVSLGYRCVAAGHLRKLGLSKQAYPLDWVITEFDSLLALIENDFQGFLEKENLVFARSYLGRLSYGTQEIQRYPHVLDTQYNLIFRHDFKNMIDFLPEYEIVKERYNKRIERLYELLHSKKHVYFIRMFITRDQAKQLTALIENKFPDLRYTLIAIDYHDEMKSDWHLANVQTFHFVQPEEDWKKILEDAPNNWKNMFQSLGFLSIYH